MTRLLILAVVGFVIGTGAAVGIVVARTPVAEAAEAPAAVDSTAAAEATAGEPAPALLPPSVPTGGDSLSVRDSIALDSIRAVVESNAAAGVPQTGGAEPAAVPTGGGQNPAADSVPARPEPADTVGLPDRRLGKIFATMQPRDAARILDQMSDHDIVVILGMMGDRQAAAVLASLPPRRAAEIGQRSIRSVRSDP